MTNAVLNAGDRFVLPQGPRAYILKGTFQARRGSDQTRFRLREQPAILPVAALPQLGGNVDQTHADAALFAKSSNVTGFLPVMFSTSFVITAACPVRTAL